MEVEAEGRRLSHPEATRAGRSLVCPPLKWHVSTQFARHQKQGAGGGVSFQISCPLGYDG